MKGLTCRCKGRVTPAERVIGKEAQIWTFWRVTTEIKVVRLRVTVYWSAFRPTWCANSSQSSMQLRDWFAVWNPATMLQMRSSAFTSCGFESGSSTSSLSWRTKCYMEVHQVIPRATCPRRRCVWSSSTPLRRHESHPDAASHVHHRRQSSLPGRCLTNLELSTWRRYLRWVAANFPEKAEKASILSIVSWLLLLTFAPAVDLAVAVPHRPL